MAINTAFGFFIGGTEPVDSRLVLSKEQMKKLPSDEMPMPPVYLAVCKDDDEIYIFDEKNEKSEETGFFMKYKGSSTASAIYHEDKKQLEFLF